MEITMLEKSNSFDKLIVEAYKQTGVQAEIKHGWATASQKNNLKGLTVLIQAVLNNGTIVPVGSTAYIKEESLHTQQCAKNKLKCETIPQEFIIVTMNDIEYLSPPQGTVA